MTVHALFSTVPPTDADSVKSLGAWLDLLALPEELGLDGLLLTAASSDIGYRYADTNAVGWSPWQLLALLAARTKRMSLGLLDLPLPLLESPLEWGRELASLQRLAAGRLKVGVGLGAGEGYARLGIIPNDAMARLKEGIELWQKLCPTAAANPFTHAGRFWQGREILPEQGTALPDIWVTGNGSRELSQMLAALQLHYITPPGCDVSFCQTQFKQFRSAAKKQSSLEYEPQLAWQIPIFLAEQDAQAWQEFEPIHHQLVQQSERARQFPPGYLSVASKARLLQKPEQFLSRQTERADLLARGFALVGSPATVREHWQQHLDQLGAPHVFAQFHFPGMTVQQTQRNLRLFSEVLRVE